MLEGFFELTIMFFGLTSSLTTFQAIINEVLRNLINTREMVSFINDVIVGMEKEDEYNKVVEEVVIEEK